MNALIKLASSGDENVKVSTRSSGTRKWSSSR